MGTRTQKQQSAGPPLDGDIAVPAGSRKSMAIRLNHELWKRGRIDERTEFVEARGERFPNADKALKILTRSSTSELQAVALRALEPGDVVQFDGRVTENRDRKLLDELTLAGVEVREPSITDEEPVEPDDAGPRYIDMTGALMGFSAVVMAMRYLALGTNNRELYVLAGLGYAFFILFRIYGYDLKASDDQPELDGRGEVVGAPGGDR